MPYTDPTALKEYQRTWIANRRASFFAGKSCENCDSTSHLELDHIDPAQKVSHRIWSWSTERRNAEIAKCQVLCKDCHLDKTASERPPLVHGSSRYNKGCRCEVCRQAHSARLRVYRAKLRSQLATQAA